MCIRDSHYDEFVSRLPGLWSLFDGSNLVTLASVICGTKILHELGHAYTHKRFGGECHEIGMMIFFFVPTLYCNTSDSWMMTDKWKRMAIGAGGVYVEMVILAISTYLWWYRGVGLVQDVCFNLMVVCSISAALTNGNPLMRYDGYFVLADWLEIPNLSQKSNKEVRRRFLNKCLGIEREVDHWSSRFNKRVFLAYGLASFAYKVLLIVAISFFLTQQFQFAGLANLGLMIAFVSLSGLFTPPIKSMYEYFKQPGSSQRVSRTRTRITLGVLAAILSVIFLLPFPFYVPGECTVEMVDQQTVFAVDKGRIEIIHARPGQWVEKDQPIMQLSNADLEAEILDLEIELDELNLKLDYLRTPNQTQDASEPKIESESGLMTTRRKLKSSLSILQSKKQALLVSAPRSGYVYGVTIGERQADTNDDSLNQIFGSPLDESNLGAWLESADEICQIGDRSQQEVILLMEQKQNGLIEAGQKVSILLSSLSSQRLSGKISAVSLRENGADDVPAPIYQESSSAMVAQIKEAENTDKRKEMQFKDGQTLSSTMVQACVELVGPPEDPLNFASVGKARVYIGNRTAFWRIKRSIDELFQQSF